MCVGQLVRATEIEPRFLGVVITRLPNGYHKPEETPHCERLKVVT
jgi:hypothetical protein